MENNPSYPERFSDDQDENLRMENEILKIKLHAQFGGISHASIIDRQLVNRRLIQFITRTNMTIMDIAKQSGISKENLYKWNRGTLTSATNDIEALHGFLDRMGGTADADFLTGVLAKFLFTLQSKIPIIRLPLTTIAKPVYDIGKWKKPGTVLLINDEPYLVVEPMDVPFLANVEGSAGMLALCTVKAQFSIF